MSDISSGAQSLRSRKHAEHGGIGMRALAILVLLSGCVSSRAVTGPDGGGAFEASCNGRVHSMADCYDEARARCGGKFERLDEDREHGFYVNGDFATSTIKRHFLFRCIPNDPAPATAQ